MSKEIETKPAFTDSDIKAFEEYTRRIKAGAQTFLEVGQALIEVRDRRYYLMSHGTFDDYCKETCKFSRQRAHQLMDAASVVQALPSNLSTVVDTERKARALKKIKPERRAEAVKKAAKNGDSSAQALEDIRKQQEEESGVVTHEEEARKDDLGNVIGEPTLTEWDAGLTARDALNHLAKAKGIVNSLWKSNDRVFAGKSVNHGAMLEALEAARMKIKEIVPYAVCAQCNGSKKRDKCPLCLGRGYLSKFYYDSYLAQETKDEQAARR